MELSERISLLRLRVLRIKTCELLITNRNYLEKYHGYLETNRVSFLTECVLLEKDRDYLETECVSLIRNRGL